MFNPTDEQAAAVDLFRTGNPMAIQAGAGTGKTSTLLLLADADPRRGQYLAFNKAIVEDAKAKMPARVAANTAHSLAFRTEGKRFAHRLKGGRVRSEDVARKLGIDPIVISTEAGTKRLAPGFLAGYVMRAVSVFCQSADERPDTRHFPYLEGIDLPTSDGHRTYGNQQIVRDHLLPALSAAWGDLSSIGGSLRFSHDCYLKLWQLSRPVLGADYIMLDEAQDTNPVLLDVFWRQGEHAQLVAVGDDNQAIYEWRGAVNALGALGDRGAATTYLSQSFRFGQAIADVANTVLGHLHAELRLTGTPTIASTVGPLAETDCTLTRTNAAAMRAVLEELAAGRRPHLVGGGAELTSFARGALDLMERGRSYHPELACFDSWGEVQEYVEHDQQGDELRLMVGLMDEYGPARIIDAIDRMPAEKDATLVVSTAHKSKGREWRRVTLGEDFPTGELRPLEAPEWRLLYVAATRAQEALDIDAVAVLKAPRTPDTAEALPAFYTDDTPARSCPGCGRADVFTDDGAILFDGSHLGCTGTPAEVAR